MAGIPKKGLRVGGSLEVKSMAREPEEKKKSDEEVPDDFVALDIATLPLLSKYISRKGFQRANEEKKAPEEEAVQASAEVPEKSAIVVHVAGDGESCIVSCVTTPTVRCRRVGGRRTSPRRLNPRRVLFFFSTLSCLGTLIVLYLTLSVRKISGNDADAH